MHYLNRKQKERIFFLTPFIFGLYNGNTALATYHCCLCLIFMIGSAISYDPLCPSVGWSVGWLVGWSVGDFLKLAGSSTSMLVSEHSLINARSVYSIIESRCCFIFTFMERALYTSFFRLLNTNNIWTPWQPYNFFSRQVNWEAMNPAPSPP